MTNVHEYDQMQAAALDDLREADGFFLMTMDRELVGARWLAARSGAPTLALLRAARAEVDALEFQLLLDAAEAWPPWIGVPAADPTVVDRRINWGLLAAVSLSLAAWGALCYVLFAWRT